MTTEPASKKFKSEEENDELKNVSSMSSPTRWEESSTTMFDKVKSSFTEENYTK